MHQKYIERLEQVVRVLKELPPKKEFDLDNWFYKSGFKTLDEALQGGCGTTACAVGWAASDPWFRKRGLTLKQHDFCTGLVEISFRGLTDDRAVEDFFGINNPEVDYLFYSTAYKRGNRADVWRRIEKFVRLKKAGKPIKNRYGKELSAW